jgi:hypothetical protein
MLHRQPIGALLAQRFFGGRRGGSGTPRERQA